MVSFVSADVADGHHGAGSKSVSDEGYSRLENGLQIVDGKPFIKTSAWWGVNHWMAGDAPHSAGSQLSIGQDELGGRRDFYGRAGFTTGYFTILYDDIPGSLALLKDYLQRARKTGQKVVLHLGTDPSKQARRKFDWKYVEANGSTKPIDKGFHHNAAKHAEAMREDFAPIMEAVRNEKDVIGYQLGGESWAAISYDAENTAAYREWLRGQFPLEELSVRYGKEKLFYKSWEEVNPPVATGPLDFAGKPLANARLAWTDWARFNKKLHADSWVAMIGVINELDGHGRPISFEYNHGPYTGTGYGLYNWDMAGVASRATNFTVGPGQFSHSLEDSLGSTLFTRSTGNGPHFMNELGAGSGRTSWAGRPAFLRRHLWWSLASGMDGFNIWTFFNVLGANSEFVGGKAFDPILTENLPSAYFEVQNVNRMITSLRGVLDASTSLQPEGALLYLEDSNMADMLVISYRTDDLAWMSTVAGHGFADRFSILTEHHVDHDGLAPYRVLILPNTPRITAKHADKLAAWVKAGGTLVMMAGTASLDDAFESYPKSPGGPLAEVAGVECAPLKPEELRNPTLDFRWKNQLIHLDVRWSLRLTTAKALLKDAKDENRILATVNSFGRGQVVVLAGKPLVTRPDDPTSAFLGSILTMAGFNPSAQAWNATGVDAGVYLGCRKAPQGRLVIAIENQDRPHNLRIRLDPVALGLDPAREYHVFECFSNEATVVSARTGWSFPTRLEPVSVRVYLVTQETSLDHILPPDQRIRIDWADPTQVLVDRAHNTGLESWGEARTYTVGDTIRETRNARIEEAISCVGAHAPRDLGGGYAALDLDGIANRPVEALVQDTVAPQAFGATLTANPSGAGSKIPSGIVTSLGAVPLWGNGRFLEMTARRVEGIPVGRRVESLSFFQHANLEFMHEAVVGYYQINYQDGSCVEVPIALTSTLGNISGKGGVPPGNTVVWEKTAPTSHLLRFDWKNPFPGKVVTSVDIIRNETATFTLWAITAKGA